MLAKIKRARLTRKYGIQIPEACRIGAGLCIVHSLPLVVHYNTIIGKNCTIHQFVTIGGTQNGKAPNIGNNCFIGASSCIIGNINIGNNVTIAAGAVVTSDIPDNATVGGILAKILHFDKPGQYIKNPV